MNHHPHSHHTVHNDNDDDDDDTMIAPTAPVMTLRVAVGSTNPSKLRAVRQALQRALLVDDGVCVSADSNEEEEEEDTCHTPVHDNANAAAVCKHADIQGFDVASGVSHQPFGDDETRKGARNRAKAAYQAYLAQESIVPHLAIGMEGGLEWHEHTLMCMAWMVVYGRRTRWVVDWFASDGTLTYHGDRQPVVGAAKTAGFALPPAVTKLVHEQGMELGDADDQVFDRVQSKHGSGTVGILTKGLIDRSAYYEHALLLAMVPWMKPDLYPNGT